MCDFYLWGTLKNNVYRNNPHTVDELKENITEIRKITEELICVNVNFIKRCQKCVAADGHHTSVSTSPLTRLKSYMHATTVVLKAEAYRQFLSASNTAASISFPSPPVGERSVLKVQVAAEKVKTV